MINSDLEGVKTYMLVLNHHHKLKRDYERNYKIARDDSYDHSAYGHSGSGHSGYGRTGSHSGYGDDHGYESQGYSSYGGHCCPLVLDPLLFLTLLGISF